MNQQAVLEVATAAMGEGTPPADAPQLSVAVGVVVALGASWLSSLGLTIQRKSHLQNEKQPIHSRKRDFQRPLWLLGFAIFITSNVLGSVFQIGALSITLLAPLGAVSLLWNAFFARVLLGDVFSRYLIFGTIFIAGGAVLIAIFGVVPEKTHSLEELIQLYSRTSFIIWMVLQFVLLVAILCAAHYTEHCLEQKMEDVYIAIPTSPDYQDHEPSESEDEAETPPVSTPLGNANKYTNGPRKIRRWSTPPSDLGQAAGGLVSLHDSVQHSERSSEPHTTSMTVAQASVPGTPNTLASAASQLRKNTAIASRTSRHVSFGQTKYRTFGSTGNSAIANEIKTLHQKRGSRKPASIITNSIQQRYSNDKVEKIRLWLGIAYGSASGTMSGLCLLFAKTGVELLILTVVGRNQFKRWESWMIVLALLVCALLQLFYLNKSLRLVGPTLICPLAFCFYNLSSIFNGLMYYDQWSRLTPLQDGLMSLGIAVLLGGVWIVSIKSPAEEITEDIDMDECSSDEESAFLSSRRRSSRHSLDAEAGEDYDIGDDEENEETTADTQLHKEETFGDLKTRIASLYQAFLTDQAGPPRGFSIGISASSPGFAIRPQSHHARRNTMMSMPSQQRSSNNSSTANSPLGTPRVRHSRTRSDDFGFPVLNTDAPSHALPRTFLNRPSDLLNRSASEPTTGAEAEAAATSSSTRERDAMLSHRHRRKRSLAGEYYVGSTDPFAEPPVLQPDFLTSLTSPTSPRHGRTRAGSVASLTKRSNTSATNVTLDRQASQDSAVPNHQVGNHKKRDSLSKYLPWHVKSGDGPSTADD